MVFHPVWSAPSARQAARRETDTMDTFATRGNYALLRPQNIDAMVKSGRRCSLMRDQQSMPPVAAVRTSTSVVSKSRHLAPALCALLTKVMRDPKGLVTIDEPFTKLLCQGEWC
jgi:leucyl-tRNA synthetase